MNERYIVTDGSIMFRGKKRPYNDVLGDNNNSNNTHTHTTHPPTHTHTHTHTQPAN